MVQWTGKNWYTLFFAPSKELPGRCWIQLRTDLGIPTLGLYPEIAPQKLRMDIAASKQSCDGQFSQTNEFHLLGRKD